ncbi:hypothetical protein PPL_01469 [Heterostelium album PN500]|uniref:J domain-containing protein n=1 Tax=Heterostelium pallidum (strain ATCC 26659 / Pp 5 / PN500) TaxID=670386 RepID=D3AZC9_HETP5|nr:hypothetical protein PPL_01469 [Heterostelium album PN500]EFA85512.1 hypothetical protein PPL_01469 [Heterostelium album PN500]|eukprot:XP_020437620.1 hypothetical protein PPL_01469 [Heterostelium album PN500]
MLTIKLISVLLLITLIYNIDVCQGRTSSYYSILNDISAGVNYYSLLGVNNDASERDIKKAFRKLSLEHHPDKNNGVSSDIYVQLTHVYQILSDKETREEYDDLLVNGIPAYERYYGRYAYHYTGVSHDIRYVLAGLVGVITVVKYLYQLSRHKRMTLLAKRTARYQKALQESSETGDTAPEVHVQGAEKPTWQSLVVFDTNLNLYNIDYVLKYFSLKFLHQNLQRFLQPKSKTHFLLNSEYQGDRALSEFIPQGITHVTVNYDYEFISHPTYNTFPAGITHIQFLNATPVEFTEDMLPSSIRHLALNDIFYQNIRQPGLIPRSLTELSLGIRFNQPLGIDILPPDLESLSFVGSHYDLPILPGYLPNSLTSLILGHSFNQPIYPDSLPPKLKYLHLGANFSQTLFPSSFPSLTHLATWGNSELTFKSLRNLGCLTYLVLECEFNQQFQPGDLPNTLEYLSFGYSIYNQPFGVNVLPPNIRFLQMGTIFDHPIGENVLPVNLEVLIFGKFFNQPLEENVLPPNLEHLEFSDKFNQPLKPNVIPDSLRYLLLDSEYSHDIGESVLANITTLFISGTGTEECTIQLPSSLRHLILGKAFNKKIKFGKYPDGLTHFQMESFVPGLEIPKKITHLDLGYDCSKKRRSNINDLVPESVTHLSIGVVGCPLFPRDLLLRLEKITLWHIGLVERHPIACRTHKLDIRKINHKDIMLLNKENLLGGIIDTSLDEPIKINTESLINEIYPPVEWKDYKENQYWKFNIDYFNLYSQHF